MYKKKNTLLFTYHSLWYLLYMAHVKAFKHSIITDLNKLHQLVPFQIISLVSNSITILSHQETWSHSHPKRGWLWTQLLLPQI